MHIRPPNPATQRVAQRMFVAACLAVGVGWGSAAAAQGVEVAKANKVKVAYLYNFSRYVDWPDAAFRDAQDPFVIGVLGADPFGSTLDRLAKKRHGGKRPIRVKRFASWDDYEPCHVLFLPSAVTEEDRAKAISLTRTSPLLVVSDIGSTAELAPPMRLYLDGDGTIGFEINISETRRRSLKVNAKLLKLARVVETPPSGPSAWTASPWPITREASRRAAAGPEGGRR